MLGKRIGTCGLILAIATCCLIGCGAAIEPGRGVVVSGTIGGVTTTVSFGPAGIIVTRSNETVQQAAALRLFEEDPTDRPETAQMVLLTSDVTVTPLDVAKRLAPQQAERINGSATVDFAIATGSSADLCASATYLSTYELDVVDSAVSVRNENADVPQDALDVLLTNDITVCMDVTADFEAKLVMDAFDLEFGPSAATNDQPDPGDDTPPDDDPVDTPSNAVGLAGCWHVHYTDAYSPDPTSDVEEEGDYILTIDSAGRLESIWAYKPGVSIFGRDWSAELFRFTIPNVGTLADAVISRSQNATVSGFGTHLTIEWDLQSYGTMNCQVFTEAIGHVGQRIEATLSGIPTNRFEGTMDGWEYGERTDDSSITVDKEYTANVVGVPIDCPDPTREDVESQDEIHAEACSDDG